MGAVWLQSVLETGQRALRANYDKLRDVVVEAVKLASDSEYYHKEFSDLLAKLPASEKKMITKKFRDKYGYNVRI